MKQVDVSIMRYFESIAHNDRHYITVRYRLYSTNRYFDWRITHSAVKNY